MQNSPRVYFISGVSGVGKSTVLIYLREALPTGEYEVRDLDERGVPDGGGLQWLSNETLHWLEVAAENAKNKKSTVICGFAEPAHFAGIFVKESHPPAELVLLHASGETIRRRLLARHSTPESIAELQRGSGRSLGTFIEDNVSYASELYRAFEKNGSLIINTDEKTPEEVAGEIVASLVQVP